MSVARLHLHSKEWDDTLEGLSNPESHPSVICLTSRRSNLLEPTSDKVLAHLRLGLLKLGYEVEGGKHRAEKIRRSVLFGDQGRERVA